MTLTTEQLDSFCGGAPTIALHCPFCIRTVGPYYAVGEAKAALRTHMGFVHFPDQIKPDRQVDTPKKATRARRFRVK